MNTNQYYFNRRGSICALGKSVSKDKLSEEEQVVYRALEELQTRFFVVMKHISANKMLVAPVFKAKRMECRKIGINHKEYWVNFMTFYVVPVKMMETAPGKYLDHSYTAVTDIYHAHNTVLQARWDRENAAKQRPWNPVPAYMHSTRSLRGTR